MITHALVALVALAGLQTPAGPPKGDPTALCIDGAWRYSTPLVYGSNRAGFAWYRWDNVPAHWAPGVREYDPRSFAWLRDSRKTRRTWERLCERLEAGR